MSMEHVEKSLNDSVDCYRELLELYANLGGKIASGATASTLQAEIGRISDLSNRARHADARVREGLAEIGGSLESLPMFPEWKRILGEVLERNSHLQCHIKAAMAVIGDDLFRLRQAKQALSGYRSGQETTGSRIDIPSA